MAQTSHPPESSIDTDALAAGLPAAIRQAIDNQDEMAFANALSELGEEEQDRVMDLLDRLAAQRRVEMQAQMEEMQAALAHLPIGVRLAVLDGNPLALQSALANLPPEQAQQILEDLMSSGFLEEEDEGMAQLDLSEFEPLIGAILAVARGDPGARPQVEDFLADLEAQGWQLLGPVQRIWEGERGLEALVEGLDEQDTRVVGMILERLG
ncbi:MAG: hypothetical protein JXB15_01195 [Anaerolineales bacterium]|nr:hypothetical protein [Anaerolineales bacterium]